MTRRTRRSALLLLAAALSAATIVPLWLTRERLPDPVATHWSLAWTPDGWMPLSVFVALMVTLACAGAGLLLTAALVSRSEASPRHLVRVALAFVGGQLGGLAATIAGWTSLVQGGLADSRTVPGPGPLALAAMMTVPPLLGAGAGWLARGARSEARDEGAPASLGLRAGESAVWVQRVAAPWAVVIVLVGLVHVGGGLLLESLVLGAGGAVLTWVGLVMSSIRVSADVRGLTVRWGPTGLLRTTVPLRDIVRAEAIDVSPMEWGGWGYRGSLWLLGRAAIVMRAGPGLRLDLRSGRVLAVTVDDAGTAAGLLNDLVARFGTGAETC